MNVFVLIKDIRTIYPVIAIGFACFVTPAFAAEPSDVKSSEAAGTALAASDFEKLDTNADGKLSDKEVASDKSLTGKFKFVDSDGDGGINADEYDKFKKLVRLK